jgi:hypothetical protein
MTEDHDQIIRHAEKIGVLESRVEALLADKKKGVWAILVLLGNAGFDRFIGGL